MGILIGLMIVAGGMIVICGEFVAIRELKHIRSWPQTRGRVKSFAVSKTLVGDIFPSISYRYEVDGNEFTGDVIRPGGRVSFRSRKQAKAMEEKYIPGGWVTVYYNPESPEDCCIDRGETAAGKSAMLWGMSIAVLGAYVLFRAVTE